MPRIKALKVNYTIDIGRYIKAYMVLADKSQEEMAYELGISQQAFGKKLKTNHFLPNELTVIFNVLGVADEGILELMKG